MTKVILLNKLLSVNSEFSHPTLVCPYTLIEEEALIWSILLFNQVVLLHPYPLSLPPSCRSLVDLGLLQVRTMERTREEIREKDRKLRDIRTYISNDPEKGYLKYLKQVDVLKDQETEEEIVGLLKGRPLIKPFKKSSITSGPILLCLIHEWMMQEWEVEVSLAEIEEQEKILAQGWQENPEDGSNWKPNAPPAQSRNEFQILCPPALAAWRELKKQLSPEPLNLFTTEQWVWTDHYGLDPEEGGIISIPLPDLSSLISTTSQKHAEEWVPEKASFFIREKAGRLLQSSLGADQERSVDEFQKFLSGLGLPLNGKYKLILPPIPPFSKEPPSHWDKNGTSPLILLSPTRAI